MNPQLFGVEHILYILISTALGSFVLLCGKKYAKTEEQQSFFLKILASALFLSIMANRLSQVFRHEETRWRTAASSASSVIFSL